MHSVSRTCCLFVTARRAHNGVLIKKPFVSNRQPIATDAGIGLAMAGVIGKKGKENDVCQLSVYLPHDPPEHIRRTTFFGSRRSLHHLTLAIGPIYFYSEYGIGSGVENEISGCWWQASSRWASSADLWAINWTRKPGSWGGYPGRRQRRLS